MKKLIILIVMCLSVCVSCRQNKISHFVGKWQGVKIITDGEEWDELSGIPVYALYQFEICEDGSVVFGETASELITDTWNWREIPDSTKIELYSNDDIEVLALDNGGLVYSESENDGTLYLEKVDEFSPYEIPKETTENITHEYINADPTAFIGDWKSIGISVPQKKQYIITDYSLEDVFRLTINDDHTAVVSGTEISGSENPVTYTWGMVSDTEIEFFSDNDNIILLSLDNEGLLVYDNSAMTVSLRKL
ncbi:MAG: hypothetical protein NC205_07795 [Prevotella sp.]|nr:hypothetical protein [Alistipes senegalensis]MCM1358483.1 hypothetical protein [Prevotella sp.]MCM1473055.1 hypothetical protein [Muribaculaceae bacterium]